MSPAQVEAAFRAACADELAAPKPGNVHVHADGHRMTVADFVRSADAAAGPLCEAGAPLGRRVLGAVTATRAVVGQNTNLGIVMLCAPLAMAAQAGGGLAAALRRVLDATSLDDAEAVFRAIALAAPGGLGAAPRYDVHAPATATLAVAMADAAHRDRIARQYGTGFADIFGPLASSYGSTLERHGSRTWAAVGAYLHCLAAWPDSHIARKHGDAAAAAVRIAAAGWEQRLRDAGKPEAMLPDLLAWDRELKLRQINPGASADLTVATIFAHRLREQLALGGR